MPLLYLFKFVIPLFPHWALFSSNSLPFNPLQVCTYSHTSTWWIRRTFQIFKLGSIWYPNIHWIMSSLCYDFDYPYLFWWSVYLFISMLCKIYVFLIRFLLEYPTKGLIINIDLFINCFPWQRVGHFSNGTLSKFW